MGIKIGNVFSKIKDKYKIELIAGERGLDRIAKWIHVVEHIEISSFLQGGDLVFTTGVALKEKEDLNKLIKENIKNKASAMFINIGPFVEDICQESIDYCNEEEFPLFIVPWEVEMAKIMRFFSKEIHENQEKNANMDYILKKLLIDNKEYRRYKKTLEKQGINKDVMFSIILLEFIDKPKMDLLKWKRNYIGRYDCNNKIYLLKKDKQYVFILIDLDQLEMRKTSDYIQEKLDELGNLFYMALTSSNTMLYKSYAEAIDIMNLAKKFDYGSNVVLTPKSFGITNILWSLEDKEVLRDFHDKILGDLVNYDRLNGTDYLETLKIYLKYDSGVKETAEKMFVHRNTVNYKIKKIREILGYDVFKPLDKVNLILGYLIREIIY